MAQSIASLSLLFGLAIEPKLTNAMNHKPYKTLTQTAEYEIEPIKGSRFIGFAGAIESDAEALDFVEQIKSRYPDARHWCWAYQLREQKRTRFNDDGEPSGSAGKPILAPIVGRELLDCLVVVVRYFGGVKLGVGGLVRAYSQAANAVLNHADIVEVVPKVTLQLDYGYDDTGQIAAALAAMNMIEENSMYTDRVTSTVLVVPDAVETAMAQLINYTSGKVRVKILEESI